MDHLFNRILVPVDFSSTAVNTIERAVDIAKQYHCSIHLLHVISDRPPGLLPSDIEMGISPEASADKYELEFQLVRLISHIRRISNNSVEAGFSIERGAWNSWVIDLVNQNGFDLVVLGQAAKAARKRKRQLDVDKIAARTDVPVITIPSGRRLKKFYSVLIPITNFLPVRKLMYAVYIASRNGATVKLLGIEEEWKKGKTSYFLEKSLDLIRGNHVFEVDSAMSKCHNVAEAVNDISVNEATDLVILNPGMGRDITQDGLHCSPGAGEKFVDFPVLTINPI